ncbi:MULTISPECIES: hypothetical protein [unclassified Streptomyces]
MSDDHAPRERAARAQRRTWARALLVAAVTGLTRAVTSWLLDLIRS